MIELLCTDYNKKATSIHYYFGNAVLVISLADTGVGMDEETLKRLMDALKGHRTARVGIGLGNIYQRIKSMYEDGGLRIYSRAGKGTVVQIILPAVREEDYQKI